MKRYYFNSWNESCIKMGLGLQTRERFADFLKTEVDKWDAAPVVGYEVRMYADDEKIVPRLQYRNKKSFWDSEGYTWSEWDDWEDVALVIGKHSTGETN